MEEIKESTFQDAVEWATSEKGSIPSKRKGDHLFYLILGSIAILLLLILIIYLISRDTDNVDALEMMKDDQYTYGGDYDEYIIDDGDYEGDYDGEFEGDYDGEFEGVIDGEFEGDEYYIVDNSNI